MINYRDFVSKRQAVTQALFSLEADLGRSKRLL